MTTFAKTTEPGYYYSFGVEVNGSTVSVFRNTQAWGSVNLPSLPVGRVGLGSRNNSLVADDLKVIKK